MDRKIILTQLKDFYIKNQARYGIKSMTLFGSAARNQMTKESDIDICVELETPDLFTLADIKLDVEEITSRKVDIVSVFPQMSNFLKKRIAKEGVYVR
jgi:uncharacterized protein